MNNPAHQVLTELLVLRAQAGESDAIGLLLNLWQERLLRHARRLTGKDEDETDVIQDVWIEIARGVHTLEDPSRFGPWAYCIVTRRCALGIRRQQRRHQVLQELAARQPVTNETPLQPEISDEVSVALRQLPSEQKTLLELRYLEEFNIQQIAEILNIAVGTVKSRLFHARELLRTILHKETP
jgi:RNA polymerase sigma factor (sigma-70 family)